MFKIWKCTSYEEYLNEWPSIANKFENLTRYQKSLGYENPQDFFEKNAFAAQELANNRVGNILERIFSTIDLRWNTQEELKKFTYKAIDFLRLNDFVVYQNKRSTQTSFNNGRSDSIEATSFSSMEALIGTSSWRSWVLAGIETLYVSYCENNDIPFLLDPTQFYSKDEMNKLLSKIDDAISFEHEYINFKSSTLDNKIDDLSKVVDKKINIEDKIILEQSIDENGMASGEIISLGQYDEIMFQSQRPNSTIITTSENKKRAVINLNETIGEITGAEVFQKSSETDFNNAIGRVWAFSTENNISNLNETKLNIKDRLVFKKITVIPKKLYSVLNQIEFENISYISANLKSGKYTEHLFNLKPDSFWMHSPTEKNYVFSSCHEGILFGLAAKVYVILYGGSIFVTYDDISSGKQIVGDTPDYFEVVYRDLESNEIVVENFTIPYFEQELAEQRAEELRLKELQELVKKSDLEPLKQNFESIKPVVEDLKAKDVYRMEKLGLDPNLKYYKKDGDENE